MAAAAILAGLSLLVAAAGGVNAASQANVAKKTAASNANDAKREALEAANQSTAATQNDRGEVDLQSEESLADSAILGKSKKNRLRVGRTGANAGAGTGTGLSVG
jgi:uncharacterized membrane protein YdbT with pleckstrin-like domain